jgi:hypothetical protein
MTGTSPPKVEPGALGARRSLKNLVLQRKMAGPTRLELATSRVTGSKKGSAAYCDIVRCSCGSLGGRSAVVTTAIYRRLRLRCEPKRAPKFITLPHPPET